MDMLMLCWTEYPSDSVAPFSSSNEHCPSKWYRLLWTAWFKKGQEHAWRGYEKYPWGTDEGRPLSKAFFTSLTSERCEKREVRWLTPCPAALCIRSQSTEKELTQYVKVHARPTLFVLSAVTWYPFEWASDEQSEAEQKGVTGDLSAVTDIAGVL